MLDSRISEDLAIKFSVLKKLPRDCRMIGLYNTEDMDRKPRKAVKVVFSDSGGARMANFCIETGEYLGDDIV